MCDRNFENLLDEGFHFFNFSFRVVFLSPSNTHIVTFNLVGEKEGGFVWFLRIFFFPGSYHSMHWPYPFINLFLKFVNNMS